MANDDFTHYSDYGTRPTEPAATQEWARKTFAGEPGAAKRATVEDRRARRDEIKDLKRVASPYAKELHRRSKGADIHDYDRMSDWMGRNPEGTVEDWTRLEKAAGR